MVNLTTNYLTQLFNALLDPNSTVVYGTEPAVPLAPVPLTEGAANTLGVAGNIDAAVAAAYKITHIYLSTPSAAGVFSVVLLIAGVEVWSGGPFDLLGAAGVTGVVVTLPFPITAALGAAVTAQVCSVAGGVKTIDMRIGYVLNALLGT